MEALSSLQLLRRQEILFTYSAVGDDIGTIACGNRGCVDRGSGGVDARGDNFKRRGDESGRLGIATDMDRDYGMLITFVTGVDEAEKAGDEEDCTH